MTPVRPLRQFRPAAVAGLAVAAGAVWVITGVARPFALTPAGIRDISALYVLLTGGLAWVSTYNLCRRIGRSTRITTTVGKVADLRERSRSSLVARRTALVALWAAPAAVFLRDRSEWTLPAVAVLVVGALSLLRWLSGAEPRAVPDVQSAAVLPYLQNLTVERGLATSVAPVLLVEAAMLAAFSGYTLTAALLITAGASLGTRRFQELRLSPSRPRVSRRARLSFGMSAASLLTVLALLPHLMVSFGGGGGYAEAGGDDGSLIRTIELLLGYVPARPEASSVEATARANGESGTHAIIKGPIFPGIVLFPNDSRVTTLVAPPPELAGQSGFGAKHAQPLTIPFRGAYWILRRPDLPPPKDSLVMRISPAKQIFLSNDYRPLWMEARENLGAFLELKACSAVRVDITDADFYSREVSMEVLLSDSLHRGRPVTLGRRLIVTDPSDRARPLHRTLTFSVPRRAGLAKFDEVIVRFLLTGDHYYRSARIAVEQFVLVPRG